MPKVLPSDPTRLNPEPTYHRPDSEVHLPPGCPSLHPSLVADSTATVTPDETPEATATGDMISLTPEDMADAILLEPEES